MDMTTETAVWPILTYRDAHRAIEFLQEAFGFVPTATHTSATDSTVVEHAELRWPDGGGVMLSSAGKDESVFGQRPAGRDAIYVVCQDPDALFARATRTGAEVIRGLADEDYGSRTFLVRDPEGTIWSFGTYAGE